MPESRAPPSALSKRLPHPASTAPNPLARSSHEDDCRPLNDKTIKFGLLITVEGQFILGTVVDGAKIIKSN